MQTEQTSISISELLVALTLRWNTALHSICDKLHLSALHNTRPILFESSLPSYSDSIPLIMAETATAPAATPTTNAPAAPANGATAGASNAPADQNANSRGLPYYEKLRRDLRDTIAKKRLMDKSMVSDKACLALASKATNRELIEAHHISTVIANRDFFRSE